MSDIADIASEVIEHTIQNAIKSRQIPSGKSLDYCEDCDEPIPEARKKIGGITHCIECQSFNEAKKRSGL